MPFTATHKGRRVNSLLYEEREWKELKESEREYRTLKCPECQENMIARWCRKQNTPTFPTPL